MKRSVRFKLRAIDDAHAKARNRNHKGKERVRRDACMKQLLKSQKPPYTPAVMSCPTVSARGRSSSGRRLSKG